MKDMTSRERRIASLCVDTRALGRPRPQKRNYRGLVNLSSNEVVHPEVDKRFRMFAASSGNSLGRYPCYGEYNDRLGRLLAIPPEALLVTPGSDAAIELLIRGASIQGVPILVHLPSYNGYTQYADVHGAVVVPLRLRELMPGNACAHLALHLGRVGRAVVVLVNPCGVRGIKLGLQEVKEIAQVCDERESLLVIDEAYAAFAGVCHVPLLAEFRNVVLVRSFSKTLGIAALRVGCILGPAQIIRGLAQTGISNCVSSVGLEFVTQCIEDVGFCERVVSDVRQWRSVCVSVLRSEMPRLRFLDTHANFVVCETSEHGLGRLTHELEKRDVIWRYFGDDDGVAEMARVTAVDERSICSVAVKMRQAYLAAIEPDGRP